MQNVNHKAKTFLEKWLDITVKDYVKHMQKDGDGDLYDLIVGGVEKPLLDIVLKETNVINDPGASGRGIRKRFSFKSRSKLQGIKPTCGIDVAIFPIREKFGLIPGKPLD